MALNSIFSSTLQGISGVASAINQIGTAPPRTPIDDYLESACSPHRAKPDLSLNLEICDLINAKGTCYPRDAAMGLARLINNRHDTVSSHALELLDLCVKNCGFPFHLQLGSKDFLNELVRRFPEKPPLPVPPTLRRILEFINQWQLSLVQNGKYKSDLRHISDMHRLLSSKGYRFPTIGQSQMAVMTQPDAALRSADEMEEEDMIVKKARLQELLRRARPGDLEEANKLMKEIIGFEGKVDYKAKERAELDRIDEKCATLSSIVDSSTSPGDLAAEGIHDLLMSCKAAQAKCVKLVETRDDDEHLERILELNDRLNRVLRRYDAAVHGRSPPSASPQSQPAALISFSPATSPVARATAAAAAPNPLEMQSSNPMDDLLGLAFGPGPTGAASSSSSHASGGGASLLDFRSGSSPSAAMGGAIALANSPVTTARTPPPGLPATLPAAIPVGRSPVHVATAASKPSGGATMDLLGGLATPPTSAGSPTAAASPVTIYDANGLHIELVSTPTSSGANVVCAFSNRTLSPVMDLKWQVAAAPRGTGLRVEPLSAQVLAAGAVRGVTNRFTVDLAGAAPGTTIADVRIKFMVAFQSNGVPVQGEGVVKVVP
ncbi:hypothetical protein BC828DRAFT_371924 [Blastocladiella britannica]|nr:hypothetical protein BC828DRAFT_371924 [Blastocladiella britannica]